MGLVGLFWKGMGTENIVVCQRDDGRGSCLLVVVGRRAELSELCCAALEELSDTLVKDILTVNQGITVLIRITWYCVSLTAGLPDSVWFGM